VARIALPMIGAVLLGAAQPIQAQVLIVEEVAPDPVTFTGRGNETTSEFPLVKGLTVVSFEHEGRGDFSVSLRRASLGTRHGALYAGDGEVNGSTAFNLAISDEYELVVRAKRDWRVTVSQPRGAGGDDAVFTGPGPQASPLLALRRGSHAFKLEHDGKGLFQAKLLDSAGFFVQYLIQAVGPYDGITAIKLDDDGDFILVVVAEPDVDWSVVKQY
jgi:hypothetical protein